MADQSTAAQNKFLPKRFGLYNGIILRPSTKAYRSIDSFSHMDFFGHPTDEHEVNSWLLITILFYQYFSNVVNFIRN
jgi:hypothetical protein